MASLLAKKSLARLQQEAGDTGHGLRRALGPLSLISFGIGAIVEREFLY